MGQAVCVKGKSSLREGKADLSAKQSARVGQGIVSSLEVAHDAGCRVHSSTSNTRHDQGCYNRPLIVCPASPGPNDEDP